jgi:prolipoprotein diacylglyceryltransferase
MTDNELIEQLFREARQMEVADNGFTERVMQRIPNEKTQTLSRLWTVFCVMVALVLFVVLLSVYRRFRKGTAALYLAGYGIIRFGLETLRGDPRVAFFGLSIGQLISIGVVALGIVFAAACGIFSSGRKDSAAGPSPKSE